MNIKEVLDRGRPFSTRLKGDLNFIHLRCRILKLIDGKDSDSYCSYSYLTRKLRFFIDESLFDIKTNNYVFLSDEGDGYIIRCGTEYYEFDTLDGARKALLDENVRSVEWEGIEDAPTIDGITTDNLEPENDWRTFWLTDTFINTIYKIIRPVEMIDATIYCIDILNELGKYNERTFLNFLNEIIESMSAKISYCSDEDEEYIMVRYMGADYDFDSDDGAAKFLLANKVIIGDENVEN